MSTENTTAESGGFIASVLTEIFTSPLQLLLVGIITFLVYKIFKSQTHSSPPPPKPEPALPKLKKRDFTLEDLKPFDGRGPDGRILIAVNGKVFDVTKGRRFYGPGERIFIIFHYSTNFPY